VLYFQESESREPTQNGVKVDQERHKKSDATNRKPKDVDDVKRDEAQSQRQNKNVRFATESEPTPAVAPTFKLNDVPPPSQRLDMLVAKKSDTSPTKKVLFVEESEERRFENDAYDDARDESLSRLEQVEKDPNVSHFYGQTSSISIIFLYRFTTRLDNFDKPHQSSSRVYRYLSKIW